MIINFLDGGILFEINKQNKSIGDTSIENNKLIENLYQSYIDLGCKYITTCNYALRPCFVDNWENLTIESVDLIQKFRCDNIKVLGSLPPFRNSYKDNTICDEFVSFYSKLSKIFKDKVDFFIIETAYNYNEIKKIYDIIKKENINNKIIISLYPNKNHQKFIGEYLNLDIDGLFLNCCSFYVMKSFYENFIKNKQFNKVKFGFYLNKIEEKKYAKDFKSSGEYLKNNLQKYKNSTNDEEYIKDFIKGLPFNEIFIGGCCGYGINEMKYLIDLLVIK